MIFFGALILGFAMGVATYNSLGILVERQTGRCAWCKHSLPAPTEQEQA